MRVTLAPTLSSSEKILLERWLVAALENEKFCNSAIFPFTDQRLAIYADNIVINVYRGSWQRSSSYVYLGRDPGTEDPSLRDRLSILLTLTQLCEPSAELTKACSEAITHYLLGEFRTVSEQLVSAPVPVSGLAFCTDNRVASLVGSEWMLPSGEVVDVSGPEWTVCASEVPVVRESAESTLAPINEEYQFRVGQRVYWSDPDTEDPRSGEGTIRRLPSGTEPYIEVHLDGSADDAFALAYPTELRALDVEVPPVEFHIGQRVHWDGRGFGQHDGEIVSIPSAAHPYYNIREDSGPIWAATSEELTAL